MIVEVYSQMFLRDHLDLLDLLVPLLRNNLLELKVKVLYTALLDQQRLEPMLLLVQVYSNLRVILERQLHLHHILVLVLYTASLVEQKHTLFTTKVEVYLILVAVHTHKMLLTHRQVLVEYSTSLVLLTHTLLRHPLKESSEFRVQVQKQLHLQHIFCLLYTSPSPRDRTRSRMPSSA